MGCGGSAIDRSHGYEKHVPKVSIRVGGGVKDFHRTPQVFFIFGGPGSKKGRIVEDLVGMYNFKLINAEDLLMKQAARMSQSGSDHFLSIRRYVKENPDISSLQSILDAVTKEIDRDTQHTFIISIMPNLKSFIRMEDFKQDCVSAMQEFEDKYPISFALNMAMAADRLIKKVEAESAKHTSTKPVPGEQTDEADSSRTQKRVLFYQNSVQCFLDYFQESDRLVTVDVSSGVDHVIWERVRDFFIDHSFLKFHTINSIAAFAFNQEDVLDLSRLGLYHIALENVVEEPYASADKLLESLCKVLDENDPSMQVIAVDLSRTSLQSKDTRFDQHSPSIIFCEIECGALQKCINNLEKCKTYPDYKAIVSTDNDIYLFPSVTNSSTCLNIALTLTNLRQSLQPS